VRQPDEAARRSTADGRPKQSWSRPGSVDTASNVTCVSHRQTATQMASNIITLPDITSWWFRRVLGPDLIKCSLITGDDVNDTKNELFVTTIESAILSTAIQSEESDNTTSEDNGTACQVIGLYFTPINLCSEERSAEEYTSKLVDLYYRVNHCCESQCSDNECCNNQAEEFNSTTQDNGSLTSLSCKRRIKTKKFEVIHVVLPPSGNASGVGASVVLDPSSDCSPVLDEACFRKVVKDLPWFAIPYRDIHRTVCI